MTTMKKNYEVVIKFIKDLSVEIPGPEAFLFSREYITKYTLGINITTNPLKKEMIEIITKLSYRDPTQNKKKSFFEIEYSTVIKIINKSLKKEELERVILCDVQNEIFPKLEKILINMISESGYPGIKFEKKVDFTKLFNEKFN